MAGSKDAKLIIVRRKTRLDDLITRFNTIAQARFYIEHLGADFGDYLHEHEQYNQAVQAAAEIAGQLGRTQIIDRAFLPNFIFGNDDLVIAIGQDGLVANTLKYLNRQFLIGVNPDPARWDGILLPFQVSHLKTVIPDVLRGRHRFREVTMAKTTLNDRQTLYAVNDFFIGQKTHVSARYTIRSGEQSETQSSSGIIVSTGLGSTGWLRSIIAGATAIVNRNFAAEFAAQLQPHPWDSEQLYFSVREPFPSKTTRTNLVFGAITPGQPLIIRSQMPENGVIFSDGLENDFLAFNSGAEATITIAEQKGKLVI